MLFWPTWYWAPSYTSKVEAPIIDHLRDLLSNLKKYKVVQIFSHVGR